eukprot:6994487-Alexandrium_andersonii.AAC.1
MQGLPVSCARHSRLPALRRFDLACAIIVGYVVVRGGRALVHCLSNAERGWGLGSAVVPRSPGHHVFGRSSAPSQDQARLQWDSGHGHRGGRELLQ